MSNYGKTQQFREMLYESNKAGYTGTLTFRGTVKLHGTNAGIRSNPDGSLTPMSRKSALTLQSDNAGFAHWVVANEVALKSMAQSLRSNFKVAADEPLSLFGEWAGPGIQKGVGINKIKNKSFFLFAITSGTPDAEREKCTKVWHPIDHVSSSVTTFYNIQQFGIHSVSIDMANPEASVAEMTKLVLAVENACPVAHTIIVEDHSKTLEEYYDTLQAELVGEGLVWEHITDTGKRIKFKTKGEKHSVSKVKTLVAVDPEVLKSMDDFVAYAATENRVIQAMSETEATSQKDTGDVLRWVANDILAEEADVLIASGLEWKQVASRVSWRSREIYFKQLGI